jgi:hypothetical protein
MTKNLAREFHAFHYLRRNRIAQTDRSSSCQQEMTMSALLRFLPTAADLLPWFLNFATWLAAGVLNMPEPLLHATGVAVFAQVEALENSVGKSLCPIRLARQFVAWCRRPG